MPVDAISTTKASNNALLWLLKAGCTPEEADAYGIRWHEQSERLLIPVLNEQQELSGILARATNNERPKYKAFKNTQGIHFSSVPSASTVIVVEDILSSYAVRKAGFDSAAILGTSISPEDAHRLCNGRSRIVSFFDPDEAGRQGYVKLRKALRLHPVSLFRAGAEHDPKYLSRSEIQQAVNLAVRKD